MFHDAEFDRPPSQPHCQGDGATRPAILGKLVNHRLGGENALIVIVDGGFDANSLSGINIEPIIRTPFVALEPRSHGNMCAWDANLGAPQATLADLTVRSGRLIRSSDVLQGFRILQGLTNELSRYSAWVVSISLEVSLPSLDRLLPTSVRLTQNPLHPLSVMADVLAGHGFDVLIAGGNQGCSPDPYIAGLGMHPRVITVGAADVNDLVVPLSARGPHGSTKPDIVSYTNMLHSQANGAGMVDDGTSAATALAAGLIASYRTADVGRDRVSLSPDGLRADLTNIARMPPGGGLRPNTTYGWGIF